ncbi:oxidoreductase [Microtetraspora sp. NBRC 13810]|uniref:Gfo/Idh/MocA family protein n=1 Tax=Microtetraspora sp. NBRC 13810 TaxID=3030990 RepID=UPI0024A4C2EA|nr:Gfo/Idh/MocA family oxidoreductase [Microtetraspora sp. NBRC 13810]GLW10518.1 oxidoreductase [Microtetraspora sp. NBRC 13810]
MLSWGIAATGIIAREVGRVIAAEPGMRVAAVGSRSADRARGLAAELGAPRSYGSYTELVGDPEVDAVYVAVPQSHHLEVVEPAIAAGRAVLCEKPLTTTVADAERMVKLARDAGVFLMEGMWMRFNPLVRRLADLVASEEFGRPRSVSASFGFALPYDAAAVHRLWDPALGGGALLDLGIYPLALAQLLLGEPEGMTVTGGVGESGVDAEAALLLTYPGGARALLETSLVSPMANTATVVGTAMRAELAAPFFAPQRLTVHGERAEEFTLDPGEDGYIGYVNELREVRDCLTAGRTESAVMPLADTLTVMRLLERARGALGL